jgi:hypothetical protein
MKIKWYLVQSSLSLYDCTRLMIIGYKLIAESYSNILHLMIFLTELEPALEKSTLVYLQSTWITGTLGRPQISCPL